MMKFVCSNCGSDIYAQNIVGTVPPHIELPVFCSIQCLDEAEEKVKNNANDN